MNIYKYFLVILIVFCFSFNCVYAGILNPDVVGDLADQERELALTAGFDLNTNIGDVVSIVIKAFLSLLGVIFVILIITAGYKWMTAGGEEQKINEAKDAIRRAIIGLIIIASAYAITHFVFTHLPWGGSSGGGLGGSPPK